MARKSNKFYFRKCYGSHSIGLSLEQFRKLEAACKASNRENKIDDILS